MHKLSKVDIDKFKAATDKLDVYVREGKGTWEQKHAQVFNDPEFVLNDLILYGLITPSDIPLGSNQGELKGLIESCYQKIEYIKQHNGDVSK